MMYTMSVSFCVVGLGLCRPEEEGFVGWVRAKNNVEKEQTAPNHLHLPSTILNIHLRSPTLPTSKICGI